VDIVDEVDDELEKIKVNGMLRWSVREWALCHEANTLDYISLA
jgi:hypothetical protein